MYRCGIVDGDKPLAFSYYKFMAGIFKYAPLLILIIGCAHDKIPTRTTGEPLYEFQLPPSPWKKMPKTKAKIAYQYPENEAYITFQSSCRTNLKTSIKRKQLEQLKNLGPILILKKKKLRFVQFVAHELTVEATRNERPVHLRTISFRANQCQYDFSMVASPERFSHHEGTLLDLVNSFQVIRPKEREPEPVKLRPKY